MAEATDFIRTIVAEDLASGRHREIVTRFPPEPNGYLHIGHAKAICLSFDVAEENGGRYHLRFDDTNPAKEDVEFVEAIQEDIRWLGYDWGEHLHFASDYSQALYDFAVALVQKGLAYVDDQSADEIREARGTLTEPGRESPHRTRSVEENLDLFARMRAGEFDTGSRVLRAKIDMASPNMNMRDPVIYRIQKAPHHRTGTLWPIYPMYDFAHCLSDSLEGITHSLCTLEFEDNRALYDWFLDHLDVPSRPRQIEFGSLLLTDTVLSKRVLRRLVEEKFVSGWDDPRMPTFRGMRRRGYPPEAIRAFCRGIGVAKRDATIDLARLEHDVRDQLNRTAPRRMAVLNPVRVVLTNYPEAQTEELEAINNPEDADMGTRNVPFSRLLYIERDDFREDPPRKFFRLAPGREVRLRYGYFIRCEEVVRDASGEVSELRCTYDPETRGGNAPDGRKVKGTLHWVSAAHAIPAEVRLYATLFEPGASPRVDPNEDFEALLNPDSLIRLESCLVEPSLADTAPGTFFQFERQGYFCADADSRSDRLVFNRTVGLRDTWAKVQKKAGA